jgi:hypothetical protein
MDRFEIGDRAQQFAAMAERRNTYLFEILIGQVTQDREVNIVISKALDVLGHAELFEPLRDLLHRDRSPWIYSGLAPLIDEGNGESIRKISASIADRWGPDLIAFVAGQFWRSLGPWGGQCDAISSVADAMHPLGRLQPQNLAIGPDLAHETGRLVGEWRRQPMRVARCGIDLA